MVLAACAATPPGDPTVPDYTGAPLWQPFDRAGAVDLGHTVARVPDGQQQAAGPLQFDDVTVSVGLGRARSGGNQHGVGIGLLDLDGDLAPDLVIANGVSNVTGAITASALYWNRGDGRFVDGTESSGLGVALEGVDAYSVAAGDVDGDGHVDLYIGAQPTNILLRNRGDRTFEDATAQRAAGAPPSDPRQVGSGSGKIVSVGDVDGDGWLDLLSASSTHDRPGAALLHNRGDGTFEDWTAQTGVKIDTAGNPCAALFTDYDNDADADLWIWNDRGGHLLLRNDGATFTDLGTAADQVNIRNPMGIDGADVDRDGDVDFYVSNIGRHPLLINQGDGRFVDFTDAAGTAGDYGWGLGFEDFDLDGWMDLYVTQEDDRPALVYRNLGGAGEGVGFTRIELDRPVRVADPRTAHNVAAAFADVDRDGLVDAVWGTTDGSRIVVHRNVTDPGSHRHIEVVVRDGVGARVAVALVDGEVLFRDLVGGSSRASVGELSVRLGLGDSDGALWVAVMWPDGRQRAFVNVPPGTLLVD